MKKEIGNKSNLKRYLPAKMRKKIKTVKTKVTRGRTQTKMKGQQAVKTTPLAKSPDQLTDRKLLLKFKNLHPAPQVVATVASMDNNSIKQAVKIQGEDSQDSSDDDQIPDAGRSAVTMGIIGQISANPTAAVSLVEGLIASNHVVEMDNGSSLTMGIDWMTVEIPEHLRIRKKGNGKGKKLSGNKEKEKDKAKERRPLTDNEKRQVIKRKKFITSPRGKAQALALAVLFEKRREKKVPMNRNGQLQVQKTKYPEPEM